jgi:SAM-dependent methyltransferase
MKKVIPRIEFLVQSFFRKQEFCPHCQSSKIKNLAKKYLIIKVKKCGNCYLCFTDPIYRPLLVSSLYDNLYVGNGSTTRLPNSDELVQLKNNCFESSDKHFGNRIKAIKLLGSGCKILEIGSSWGYFLYQAKNHGFEATGVEISEPRRLFGTENLGVRIVENISTLKGEFFDIVYTSHVLEHFTDVSTIFVDIHKLLNKKGKLIIEVPNFDFSIFRERALPTVGAVHPLGFSSEFFQKNLPKYNFKITGFYNSWDSFPEGKVEKSSQGVIILIAEKN